MLVRGPVLLVAAAVWFIIGSYAASVWLSAGALAVVAVFSFFLDVHFFFRGVIMFFQLIPGWTTRPLLELDTCRCRVFWTDLDFLGHMNNARYPRSADFARYQLWKLNGVFKALDKLGGFMVLGAHTIRFRRSLEPFEAFDIQSKVLGWDETNFYVEQRFVTQDGFVKAIMYARQSMVKATTAQVLETIGHTTPSPSLPRHVQHWLQFVEEDSALLRKEAGLVKVD